METISSIKSGRIVIPKYITDVAEGTAGWRFSLPPAEAQWRSRHNQANANTLKDGWIDAKLLMRLCVPNSKIFVYC